MTRVEIQVLPDAATAQWLAAERFADAAVEAVRTRGRFTVALAGGSTPEGVYRRLARQPFASRIPWGAVHLFWGDERCVPPGHPRSNYGMVRRALLEHVPIPPENVHRMSGERRSGAGRDAYARELQDSFSTSPPRFDQVLLGLGADAHTASLFPYSAALLEKDRWVERVLTGGGEARLTLTPPVLNAARAVDVLVTGAGKAEAVHRVIQGARDPVRLPAQIVRPEEGGLTWILDEDAASQLSL